MLFLLSGRPYSNYGDKTRKLHVKVEMVHNNYQVCTQVRWASVSPLVKQWMVPIRKLQSISEFGGSSSFPSPRTLGNTRRSLYSPGLGKVIRSGRARAPPRGGSREGSRVSHKFSSPGQLQREAQLRLPGSL